MKSIEELIGTMKVACTFKNEISNETVNDIVQVLENHLDLLNENAELHSKIREMEPCITSLRCEIEHLNKRPKTQTKYRVVRSFAPNSGASSDYLENAFYDGWEFVRASDFIPPQGNKVGYIEYILKKEIEVEK